MVAARAASTARGGLPVVSALTPATGKVSVERPSRSRQPMAARWPVPGGHYRRGGAGAASIVAAATFAVFLIACGRGPASSTTGAGESWGLGKKVVVSTVRGGVPSLSAVPIGASDLNAMKNYGDDVDPSSVFIGRPTVDLASAYATAAATFGFLRGAIAVSAELAYLSDARFGVFHTGGGGTSPTFVPDIHHRLVWIIVFADVKQAGSGGPSQSPMPTPTKDEPARMWFAVDAESGHLLGGRTIQ
jgi:hypothetical protein